MALPHIEIWNRCLEVIKANTTNMEFEYWFKPIVPTELRCDEIGQILTVRVPSRYFAEHIDKNYPDLINSTIKRFLGPQGRLEYRALVIQKEGGTITEAGGTSQQSMFKPPIEGPSTPYAFPGLNFDTQLKKEYSFDNFVVGQCNLVAREIGLQISQSPGTTAFNPLFIHSKTGLGKTHLCHAIGLNIKRLFSNKRVYYVQAEQFINQYVNAARSRQIEGFIKLYQTIDVLIIDDIQFLANKVRTQESFYHIFNHLYQNNRQIILTSDKMQSEIPDIEERLISRFKWGCTVELGMPDAITRAGILKKKLSSFGTKIIPDEIVNYMAENINTNVRELEGVLYSLIAQSTIRKDDINFDFAKNMIDKFAQNTVKEISVAHVVDVVCDYFGTTPELLAVKNRKQEIVQSRQIAMYFSKKYTKASLTAIGKQCGNKDHATVSHAVKTIDDRIETDKQFRAMMSDIEKKVLA